MAEQGKSPIIKKVIKKVAGGSHGGSWKVAYADFVTAMMAFFLLMWLLSMTAPEKKMQLAQYFRDYTIFNNEGGGILDKELPRMTDKISTKLRPKNAYLPQAQGGEKTSFDPTSTPQAIQMNSLTMKKRLKKIIKVRMASFKSNIMVTEEEQGLKIDIMSLEDDPLFALGGPELTETMQKILKKLYGEIFKYIGNKIIIEGHTDAIYYLNDKNTNWELSTNRALSVRREFEKLGMDSERIASIAGYASTRPLIDTNPKDPRNRRISLVLLFPQGIQQKETKIIQMQLPEDKD